MITKSNLEVIADPVRLSVLRSLADSGDATLGELAQRAGVHPNTLRRHLDGLERDGAVIRLNVPGRGRGRPRVRYEIAQGWTMGGQTGLAELLAGLVQRLDPKRSRVSAFGRQWGGFLAERPGAASGGRAVVGALENLGFDVSFGSEVELRRCPCPVVSPGDPGLVCSLACAVADGAYAATAERGRIRSGTHDPKRRRCTLRVDPGVNA